MKLVPIIAMSTKITEKRRKKKEFIAIMMKMHNKMWPYLQHHTLVKVVCTWPSLQGGESHVSSSEGRDITELIGT